MMGPEPAYVGKHKLGLQAAVSGRGAAEPAAGILEVTRVLAWQPSNISFGFAFGVLR